LLKILCINNVFLFKIFTCFKKESALFPAENQPKISSAKTQPEKNSASRISAAKMRQPDEPVFGHKNFGSGVYPRGKAVCRGGCIPTPCFYFCVKINYFGAF